DLALRLPGLVCVALAAFLPSLMKAPGLDRTERLGWGWLMFAWWGVDQFLLARGFPVMFALAAAQATVFAGLIRQPTGRRAWAWSILSAAMIMVHYYAAALVAVHGVAYLALHRKGALKTWPAALAFAPALAWMAWHAPFLAQFANASVAWHPRLDAKGVFGMAVFPLQHTAPVIALAALILIAGGMIARKDARGTIDRALWIAVAASWAALLVVIASAAWRPTLIARYLTPEVPGVLLSLVLLARGAARPKLVLAGLAAVYAIGLTPPFAMIRGPGDPSPYGHEQASQILMRHDVTDVVFLWDHETAQIQDRAALAAVGRFYFDRAGARVRVITPDWKRGEDLNRVALAAASGPRPGIIWIYNRNTPTAAKDHPPAIDRLDPAYVCQDISYAGLGSLACFRNK
ncbi:MAG TPA: hypothetical protein VFN88_11335, partial [Caulobacteraceae bacterium]|nr:hypothetical protein [Caulobacteraceae bacterium]